MIYQSFEPLISKIPAINSMKKITDQRKSKEFTISVTELSRFGRGIRAKALKVADTAKKGKIIIRIETQ